MLNFFENHPILVWILVFILVIAFVFGMVYGIRVARNIFFNGNKQVIDTNYNFQWVVIDRGDGNIIEGAIKNWNDYSDCDTVQIIMEDGTVILTHYSKILLCSKRL